MADRSGPRAPRARRADRHRSRPAVEWLEGRALMAGGQSPTNPVPIHPEPVGQPTPQQLGAAYQQILVIQADTLQQLSAAHRRLYHAYDQLAERANPAVARDRRVLQHGASLTADAERGLVTARGDETRAAYTDKIYIPQHLFTTLGELVRQAKVTSASLVRSAQRGTDGVIRRLDRLSAGLDRGTTTSGRASAGSVGGLRPPCESFGTGP